MKVYFDPLAGELKISVDNVYTHNQLAASDEWVINHNLGYRPGGVMIVDAEETIIIGSIQHIDNNQLKITFTVPTTGKAYFS